MAKNVERLQAREAKELIRREKQTGENEYDVEVKKNGSEVVVRSKVIFRD